MENLADSKFHDISEYVIALDKPNFIWPSFSECKMAYIFFEKMKYKWSNVIGPCTQQD